MTNKPFLLLTPDFPPQEGGVARYLSSLALYFHDEIEVVCEPHPDWQSTDPSAEYSIFRRALLARWGFLRWRSTVAFLFQQRARYRCVVVSHVLPFGTAAWVASWFTKVPYIVIAHGMDIRLATSMSTKRSVARRVLRHARVVVANSQALAVEIASMFGLGEVLVCHPCVDAPVSGAGTRDPSVLHLLTVARLVERKGHATVINALALLKQHGVSNIRYDIVGDGPLGHTLRSMVDELELGSWVTFHGQVNDQQREALYAAADLFVMPVSNDPVDKEGFGLVYIEAARHGVPSIATRVPGVDEAVIDGKTGILLDSQDPQELARAIQGFLADPQRRRDLGEAARQHARQFTCVQQLEKLRPFLT